MELEKQLNEYLCNKKELSKKRDYFYVSEVYKSKKELYDAIKNNKTKEIDAKGRRIFDNGDYVHSRYYKYFAEMGILVCSEVDAVKNDLIHGRADAIITDGKELFVVDIKSMSLWSFIKLKETPEKSHELQILFYMYFLNIKKGIILYECKDNQLIKIYQIELDEKKKNIVEKILDELKVLKEKIEKGIEPLDEPLTIDNLEY
jgi:CRISPR/Cas system-associated exonuclease Cas4 (RecB family)